MWSSEPCCDWCWWEKNPGREPLREAKPRYPKRCAYCHEWTESGIYVRVETVQLPE
jgi:hypothetical protein